MRELHHTNQRIEGSTFNIGKIIGGGASNVVPDKCVITMNVRCAKSEDVQVIKSHIDRAVGIVDGMDGIKVESLGEFLSPPNRWMKIPRSF